jgi:hypothetical protein
MEVTVWNVLATPGWVAPDELRLTRVQLQSMTAHPQADILNAAGHGYGTGYGTKYMT